MSIRLCWTPTCSASSNTTLPTGEAATRWRIADARLEVLAAGLLWLRWPFTVLDSPELAALLLERARTFTAAGRSAD